jgi:hypothetical protein
MKSIGQIISPVNTITINQARKAAGTDPWHGHMPGMRPCQVSAGNRSDSSDTDDGKRAFYIL